MRKPNEEIAVFKVNWEAVVHAGMDKPLFDPNNPQQYVGFRYRELPKSGGLGFEDGQSENLLLTPWEYLLLLHPQDPSITIVGKGKWGRAIIVKVKD